jgi:hypothetical protein
MADYEKYSRKNGSTVMAKTFEYGDEDACCKVSWYGGIGYEIIEMLPKGTINAVPCVKIGEDYHPILDRNVMLVKSEEGFRYPIKKDLFDRIFTKL